MTVLLAARMSKTTNMGIFLSPPSLPLSFLLPPHPPSDPHSQRPLPDDLWLLTLYRRGKLDVSGFEVRESMAGGRKSSGRGRRCGRPEQEVEAKAMYRMRLRMVRVLEGRGRKRLGAVREEGTASK